MERYNHKDIEAKWQAWWDKDKTFFVGDEARGEKSYILDMFPYPSAQGLHVGHPEGYTATDIYARYLRLKGVSVLHPMGWDAFGLPAENYAIKTSVHPRELTWQNIANFRRQIKSLGFSYDWDREVNTADPAYYKWTQWLFLKLYEKGLAYRTAAPVNWCPSCQTVLANEQVVAGECERCSSQVEQRQMAQWFFKITAYADRLLKDLVGLDWPEPIIEMQKNWIGKSEGALVKFQILNFKFQIEVFTTRLDTIFGATYLVLAPEHEAINKLQPQIKNWSAVEAYVVAAKKKTELERKTEVRDKTGVKLEGVMAVNPANGEGIPIFVADYILMGYGTGAIMAVPAHDERDWEFAKKFGLPTKEVVVPTQKRTVLILHGTGANSQKYWYQWLKVELEQRGYQVFVPDLPNSQTPNLDEWLKALEPYANYLDEHSIIVGHSLGGPIAIQLIQHLGHPVNTLVLVAPTIQGMEWGPIVSTHSHDQAVCIRTITEAPVDWQVIRQRVGRVIGLFSLNDPYIPVTTRSLYEHNLPGTYLVYEDRGHFNEKTSEAIKLPEFFSLPYADSFTDYGILINSGEFNDLDSEVAIKKIAEKIGAKLTTEYRLRDWLISRQRYWGAPIPIIYCDKCGEVPVPESDLPVELPSDVDFRPQGESPLARSGSFHRIKCPKCGASARRESDTMDTFVDSAWYFLRYADPHNIEEAFAKEKIKTWLPVDFYVGGAEHAVMHLLYARFITKVLGDLGYVDFVEPFSKLRNQGLILGEDGQKMSKSRGNVVNPDEIVSKYGADSFRLYEMFLGPLEDVKPWNTAGIVGLRRFLDRVWNLALNYKNTSKADVALEPTVNLQRATAQTIKKVTADIEAFRFNTAVSALMKLVNDLSIITAAADTREYAGAIRTLLILLYPFAPHITAELWSRADTLRRSYFPDDTDKQVWQLAWPTYDEQDLAMDFITLTVQVNGRMRASLNCPSTASEGEIVELVKNNPVVAKYLVDKAIKRVVYVAGKLINLVTD